MPRRIDPREAAALARLDRLAWLLDTSIVIPGTRWRFGVDPLLGLIPGAGDIAGAALSGYIVFEAWRLGVSPAVLARMIVNVAADTLVGAVPIAGDVFDAWWKANRRNVDLLRRHLTEQF